MTQLLGTKDDRAILHRNAHSRDRVAVAKCSDRKYNRSRLAYRHTSPQDAPKRRPGTTSGAPGESHNYVAVLFPLNQESVDDVARDDLTLALVSDVSSVAMPIILADVKVTSRAPFPHP